MNIMKKEDVFIINIDQDQEKLLKLGFSLIEEFDNEYAEGLLDTYKILYKVNQNPFLLNQLIENDEVVD